VPKTTPDLHKDADRACNKMVELRGFEPLTPSLPEHKPLTYSDRESPRQTMPSAALDYRSRRPQAVVRTLALQISLQLTQHE
jgi:hypothetical protein